MLSLDTQKGPYTMNQIFVHENFKMHVYAGADEEESFFPHVLFC